MRKIFHFMYSFNVHLFIKCRSHTLLETPRDRGCAFCVMHAFYLLSHLILTTL